MQWRSKWAEPSIFIYSRPSAETLAINQELQKLLSIGVITPYFYEPGENFSNLFIVPKLDDSIRTILNLKDLNLNCSTSYFKTQFIVILSQFPKTVSLHLLILKMLSFVSRLIRSIKNFLNVFGKAKYTNSRSCLKVILTYFYILPIPNKVMKPPFSYLRTRYFISVIYVDDSFLIDFTFDECVTNVLRAVELLLRSLGFHISIKKSFFFPSLGFTTCSRIKLVALTREKKEAISKFALMLLASTSIPIRVLASFTGRVVTSLP